MSAPPFAPATVAGHRSRPPSPASTARNFKPIHHLQHPQSQPQSQPQPQPQPQQQQQQQPPQQPPVLQQQQYQQQHQQSIHMPPQPYHHHPPPHQQPAYHAGAAHVAHLPAYPHPQVYLQEPPQHMQHLPIHRQPTQPHHPQGSTAASQFSPYVYDRQYASNLSAQQVHSAPQPHSYQQQPQRHQSPYVTQPQYSYHPGPSSSHSGPAVYTGQSGPYPVVISTTAPQPYPPSSQEFGSYAVPNYPLMANYSQPESHYPPQFQGAPTTQYHQSGYKVPNQYQVPSTSSSVQPSYPGFSYGSKNQSAQSPALGPSQALANSNEFSYNGNAPSSSSTASSSRAPQPNYTRRNHSAVDLVDEVASPHQSPHNSLSKMPGLFVADRKGSVSVYSEDPNDESQRWKPPVYTSVMGPRPEPLRPQPPTYMTQPQYIPHDRKDISVEERPGYLLPQDTTSVAAKRKRSSKNDPNADTRSNQASISQSFVSSAIGSANGDNPSAIFSRPQLASGSVPVAPYATQPDEMQPGKKSRKYKRKQVSADASNGQFPRPGESNSCDVLRSQAPPATNLTHDSSHGPSDIMVDNSSGSLAEVNPLGPNNMATFGNHQPLLQQQHAGTSGVAPLFAQQSTVLNQTMIASATFIAGQHTLTGVPDAPLVESLGTSAANAPPMTDSTGRAVPLKSVSVTRKKKKVKKAAPPKQPSPEAFEVATAFMSFVSAAAQPAPPTFDFQDDTSSYQIESTRQPTLACDVCGKCYKNGSCLAKHQWEHTVHWDSLECESGEGAPDDRSAHSIHGSDGNDQQSGQHLTKHQRVMMLEAASILVNFGHGIQSSGDPDNGIQDNSSGDEHAYILEEGQAPTTMMATRHASSSSSAPSVDVEEDDHRIWSAWFSAAARERRRCNKYGVFVDSVEYSDDELDLYDVGDKEQALALVTPPFSTPSNSPSRGKAGRRGAATAGVAPLAGGAWRGRGRLPRRADSPVTASLKKAIMRAEHFGSACAGGTLLELARARRSGRDGFAVV